MDYVEEYYSNTLGNYPFEDDDNKIKSEKVIAYLKENEIGESDLIKTIEEMPGKDYISPEMLPDWLWEDSLLERDKFYYHNTLHIKPKAPTWNPLTNEESVEEHYMEMKIKFTMDDLITYFYRELNINHELIDIAKDKGSFNFLINKYRKFDFIEPIDFILSLIDYAKSSENMRVRSVLQIGEYESEVYDMLQAKVEQAKLEKANIIVWR